MTNGECADVRILDVQMRRVLTPISLRLSALSSALPERGVFFSYALFPPQAKRGRSSEALTG
jgi:hypothetical protein